MVTSLLRKVFGSRNDRILKRLQKNVNKINMLEPELEKLSDDQLCAKGRSEQVAVKYPEMEIMFEIP